MLISVHSTTGLLPVSIKRLRLLSCLVCVVIRSCVHKRSGLLTRCTPTSQKRVMRLLCNQLRLFPKREESSRLFPQITAHPPMEISMPRARKLLENVQKESATLKRVTHLLRNQLRLFPKREEFSSHFGKSGKSDLQRLRREGNKRPTEGEK